MLSWQAHDQCSPDAIVALPHLEQERLGLPGWLDERSHPHPAALVARNDTVLIGERTATRGRIATERGDERGRCEASAFRSRSSLANRSARQRPTPQRPQLTTRPGRARRPKPLDVILGTAPRTLLFSTRVGCVICVRSARSRIGWRLLASLMHSLQYGLEPRTGAAMWCSKPKGGQRLAALAAAADLGGHSLPFYHHSTQNHAFQKPRLVASFASEPIPEEPV